MLTNGWIFPRPRHERQSQERSSYPKEQGHTGAGIPWEHQARHIRLCGRGSREGHPPLYSESSACPSPETENTLSSLLCVSNENSKMFWTPWQQEDKAEPPGETFVLSKKTCTSRSRSPERGQAPHKTSKAVLQLLLGHPTFSSLLTFLNPTKTACGT